MWARYGVWVACGAVCLRVGCSICASYGGSSRAVASLSLSNTTYRCLDFKSVKQHLDFLVSML